MAEKQKKFNKIVLGWYKKHGRDLSWRHTTDPYEILISEIMLQQTQVDRVIPKYDVFLERFPTVEILAGAQLGDVLRLWSGLGYNRRARYLHHTARIVAREHCGEFPQTMDELKRLPGIGLSTAAALLAFAFGLDEPMIDTNTRRVLSRVFFKGVAPSDKQLYQFAKGMVPRGNGREWNYALMDIGALYCRARGHDTQCPLTELHGKVGDFVYKKPQKPFRFSRRFYRGRIVSLLSGSRQGLEAQELRTRLGLGKKEFNSIFADLKREGMVKEGKRYISLP